MQLSCVRWGIACALVCCLAVGAPAQDASYSASVEAWRTDREAQLTADDGWLTLIGLHFFEDGGTVTFGTSSRNDIVLTQGPGVAGHFTRRGRAITVHAPAGRTVSVDGRAVTEATVFPVSADTPEESAFVTIGTTTLSVHVSGARLAIRIRDMQSTIRERFTGLRWFPVDPRYRVRARFVADAQPLTLEIPNVLGDLDPFTSPGTVRFTIDGRELTMRPVDDEGELWFMFRDDTSGDTTYAAARYLYAALPDETGWTTLDFNKAYNPPCAFNPYTTCPLPPLENRLPIRIEAGELDYTR